MMWRSHTVCFLSFREGYNIPTDILGRLIEVRHGLLIITHRNYKVWLPDVVMPNLGRKHFPANIIFQYLRLSRGTFRQVKLRLLGHDLTLPGGCFTNVSRALQNFFSKFVCCRNRTSYEHFKLRLCSCAKSHALGTRTKIHLEILTINVITDIVYFRDIILESSQNVSETTPWLLRFTRYCGKSRCHI